VKQRFAARGLFGFAYAEKMAALQKHSTKREWSQMEILLKTAA